jgi:ribosomal protein S6--L-glutamate ligase
MRIVILSRKRTLYSTHRLVEAAEQRGHHVRVVDYLRCFMNITSANPKVMFSGHALDNVDAIIPRIGASHTFYGTAVVRQFEMMHVFSVNESQAISRSRDKLRCLQLLAREGIGMPTTACAHSSKDVDGVIGAVGGAPLVLKLLEGTQGIGVVLAENKKAAASVIEAFRGLDAYMLVQEFIQEAKGADLRCFVVGDHVVAAMKRQAGPGEFRSNLHRGGQALHADLQPEEEQLAVHAARTLGLNVAGVDILRSDRGPLIIEVNSSPGLEGIERASHVDVAGRVIEFIEQNASPGNTRDRVRG